jgi:hypothetical protein
LVKNSSRSAATNHPAEHGIEFDVVMAIPAHTSAEIKAVFPLPTAVKGKLKLAEKREVATVIFRLVQSGITMKSEMLFAPRHGA